MAEDVTVGRLELLGRRAFIPDIEIIQTEHIEGNPAGLRIRIPIGSGFNRVCGSGSGIGIRIRIQEGKNDPQK
jgi:hypothetical protein